MTGTREPLMIGVIRIRLERIGVGRTDPDPTWRLGKRYGLKLYMQ